MHLTFRRRIFLGLVCLGTLPLGMALVVLALQVRSTGSAEGTRAAFDEIAQTGRAVVAALDSVELTPASRDPLQRHAQAIARRTTLARRAEMLSRAAAGALGITILVVAVISIAASLNLARRWSLHFSAPVDELVEWVGHIERGEPLPETARGQHDAPEFDALRGALAEMSVALERARAQALERERLMAFRDVARRVAHEIRGPLTAARLALSQLATGGRHGKDQAALDVLHDETRRLENMAREFSEFGRLPEGPEASVNLTELIENVLHATVPPDVSVRSHLVPALAVRGHYEPLRRAVQNLVRNAIEVEGGLGIEVHAEENAAGVRVTVRDHGPGVAAAHRDRIFQPYFTTKEHGTGLGLALVKQTVLAHGGTIVVQDTPGGGTTFVVELPGA